jgi:nucleoside-diphosphate-sugar epimerase
MSAAQRPASVRGDVVTKAIVIGGAGFIGGHLLEALVAERHHDEVICIDIAPPRRPVLDVRYIAWDMRHSFPSGAIGGPVGDIYSLAAVHVTPGHEDWEYYETNVSCAIQTCRLATALDAAHVTFTSSIAIYGPSEAAKDEDATPQPSGAYGRSKLQAEEIHRAWQNEQAGRRRLTIVRPGVVYGPAERGNFTRLARLLERRMFVYPGRSDTIKACGYVKELIDAILFMQRRNADVSLFNFCHAEPLTTRDICAALCTIGGYRPPRLVVPEPWMMGAAFGAELLASVGVRNSVNRARVGKLLHSSHVVPKRLRDAGYPFRFDLHGSLQDWRSASATGRFE